MKFWSTIGGFLFYHHSSFVSKKARKENMRLIEIEERKPVHF